MSSDVTEGEEQLLIRTLHTGSLKYLSLPSYYIQLAGLLIEWSSSPPRTFHVRQKGTAETKTHSPDWGVMPDQNNTKTTLLWV